MSLSGTACVCDDGNEVVDDATDADCSFRRAVVAIAVSVLVALHAEKNVGGVCIDSGGAHEFVRAHVAMRPLLAFRPVVSEETCMRGLGRYDIYDTVTNGTGVVVVAGGVAAEQANGTFDAEIDFVGDFSVDHSL